MSQSTSQQSTSHFFDDEPSATSPLNTGEQGSLETRPHRSKSPWLALLLSFIFPGLGQAYAGHFRRALLILAILLVLAMSTYFIALTLPVFIAILAVLALIVAANIMDAWMLVHHRKVPDSQKNGLWYYLLVAVGLLFLTYRLDTYSAGSRLLPIHFASIPGDAMIPGLLAGDGLALATSESFKRDDIVSYRTPQEGSELFISRIKALPGEEIGINSIGQVSYPDQPEVRDSNFISYYRVNLHSPPTAGFVSSYRLIQSSPNGKDFIIAATQKEAAELSEFNIVKFTEAIPSDMDYLTLVPPGISEYFKLDSLTYLLPYRGYSVNLSPELFALYQPIISYENPGFIDPFSGRHLIGDSYTFKENYYLLLGDHRGYLSGGIIPEKAILRKAIYIFSSALDERVGPIP